MNKYMTEEQLQRNVVGSARELGWNVHFNWRSFHSPKGWPDLVLAKPPRLIFAELKGPKGKLRPDQEMWRDVLRDCGQEWHLWRPDDLDDIYKLLMGEESDGQNTDNGVSR